MAARFPPPRHSIQHSRFTKQDGWRLWDLSLSLNGNIAVTGYNENTHRTCIDVYTNVRHSDSRDKPKIIYSKEFEKYQTETGIDSGRSVSCIDDDILASCLGDKLEVFQVNKDEVLRFRRVNGIAWCLSVSETEIFIGFYQSNKITVYDVIDLNEIKSIILQGIQDGDFPDDMIVIGGRIFLFTTNFSTEKERMLIFDETNGIILSELTKPSDQLCFMRSVSANVQLGICTVVWGSTFLAEKEAGLKIVFFSLLSENNCSFLIVEVEFGFGRIRISDRGDRMITGNQWTGEVKVFDMSEFFSYGHLKETLQSQLQADGCLKLTDYFTLPDDQKDTIVKSDKPTENLLLALEGNGVIQPSNVGRLTEAFTELGIKSSCTSLVDFYQKTKTPVFYRETIQKLQEEIKLHKENEHRLETENKAQVQNLQQELQKIKQEYKETEKLLQQTKDLHQRTALVRNKFKTERDKYKSELSILQKNLESVKQDLLHTKEVLTKVTKEKNAVRSELEGRSAGDRLTGTVQEKSPEVRRRSDRSVSSATSRYLQESAIEGEFSMLLVKIAVKLTKNNCVLLATYFNLPEYKTDLIREDTGTPGITLLGVMKERNIINMYDVSKLQQALVDIELRGINQTLVKPYQEKIHPLLYEQHKVEQDDC